MQIEAGTVKQKPLARAEGLVMDLDTSKGRAVFATKFYAKGTVIEISPVLVLPMEHLQSAQSTILNHYTYNWPVQCNKTGKTVQSQAIALGLGSLFNHSTGGQNVGFERDLNMQCITYEALRDIQPNEELCINYGRIWFQDADEDAAQQQSEDINSLDRIQDDIY